MDSFYGGKRGFSFILRPNPDDINGYWQTASAIATAAQNKVLKQGEYAIVTEAGDTYSEEHGKLYRITKDSGIELVGKIGNPAPLYGLEITNSTSNNNVQFYFLDDETSKDTEGFKVYWQTNRDENDQIISIGIGFEFPHPVFEVENKPANYFQLVEDQIEAQKPAGMTIAPNSDQSVYYKVENIIPSATYIGTRDSRKSLGTLNLNLGDLWMETIDDTYKIIKVTQRTESIKKLMKKESNFANGLWETAMQFKFPQVSQSTTIYPYTTDDERVMYDILDIDFTNLIDAHIIPKLPYAISSLYLQNSKSLMINLSFINKVYEQSSPFTHYDLYAQTDSEKDIVLQGKIGEPCDLTNFIYWNNRDSISAEDLAEDIQLIRLCIYGTYSTIEQEGYIQHENFIASPFGDFQSANNTTDNILGIIKSFGITWYPPDSEVE